MPVDLHELVEQWIRGHVGRTGDWQRRPPLGYRRWSVQIRLKALMPRQVTDRHWVRTKSWKTRPKVAAHLVPPSVL